MYQIALDEFEGPLDLLLFFIKRDELDVYDIPIARITDEYLQYVQVLEQVDLDGAGEFIYMAALLMRIKVQMLLPDPRGEEDGEEEDPRRELVERLLEYIRHKEAARHLDAHHQERSQYFTRGDAAHEKDKHQRAPKELEYQVSVFDLISVLTDVLREEPDEEDVLHEIEAYNHSVEEQQEYVLQKLQSVNTLSFIKLVRSRSKQFVITTFLAVLELAKAGRVQVSSDVSREDFFVEGQETTEGEK